MLYSVITYLQWVFPVSISSHGRHAVLEGVKYTSERDIIIALYSKFMLLPVKYYEDRGFDKVWGVVSSVADEDEFLADLESVIAEIAWGKGFVGRVDRILVAYDNAAYEYYWIMSCGNYRSLAKFALKHMGKAFNQMVFGGNVKSLIESFHEKKREEFMRRFELIRPQQAKVLRECLSDKEVERFLKKDPDFMLELRKRLTEKGDSESLDYLFGADLGL